MTRELTHQVAHFAEWPSPFRKSVELVGYNGCCHQVQPYFFCSTESHTAHSGAFCIVDFMNSAYCGQDDLHWARKKRNFGAIFIFASCHS